MLAALPGTWGGGKPVAFSYQWTRCDAAGHACAAITAATARSYTPTAADVGHALAVRVSAVTPAGTASASSAPTLAVASSGASGGTAPKAKTLPLIQGGNQVGQTLTAQVGTWTGSPTSYSYQWRRCAPGGTACVAIPDAAGDSYATSPGDIGFVISLTVTAIGKGGAGSSTSAPTAIILAAPVPAPAVETTIALPGQAGAVTTASSVAIATWQPGALPSQAAVGLVDTTSHLSLRGTSVRLSFGATAPLPWPIDVQYPNAPADTVPGILPLKGVWQPLAELPTPALPAAQMAGTYRDPAGTLHLLTRTAGRIALFAAGKWGDPRYATALKPRVALVNHVGVEKTADGGLDCLRADHARYPGPPLPDPARRERHQAAPPSAGIAGRHVVAGEAGEDAAGFAAAAGRVAVQAPRPGRPVAREGQAHIADRGAGPVWPEVGARRQARLTRTASVIAFIRASSGRRSRRAGSGA